MKTEILKDGLIIEKMKLEFKFQYDMYVVKKKFDILEKLLSTALYLRQDHFSK